MLYELKDISRKISQKFNSLSDREKDIVREVYNIMTDYDNYDETFEQFWNYFHTHVNLPRTDKARAFKAWKKMTLTDKRKAYARTKMYASQKPVAEHSYLRKACYYLSDELYKDDLVPAGNSDSPQHADNMVRYIHDNVDWIEEIANTYNSNQNEIISLGENFIQRCYLSGTLPTDIAKFKIKFIDYINSYDVKHRKNNKREDKYRDIINSIS